MNENASVAYSALSLSEFNALSQRASSGQIPGVSTIPVPTSVDTPFKDTLFSSRADFRQSDRLQWFLRGAFDLNRTKNDLVHEGALPSTGFTTTSHYYSLLLSNQLQFSPVWVGNFVFQFSDFQPPAIGAQPAVQGGDKADRIADHYVSRLRVHRVYSPDDDS